MSQITSFKYRSVSDRVVYSFLSCGPGTEQLARILLLMSRYSVFSRALGICIIVHGDKIIKIRVSC